MKRKLSIVLVATLTTLLFSCKDRPLRFETGVLDFYELEEVSINKNTLKISLLNTQDVMVYEDYVRGSFLYFMYSNKKEIFRFDTVVITSNFSSLEVSQGRSVTYHYLKDDLALHLSKFDKNPKLVGMLEYTYSNYDAFWFYSLRPLIDISRREMNDPTSLPSNLGESPMIFVFELADDCNKCKKGKYYRLAEKMLKTGLDSKGNILEDIAVDFEGYLSLCDCN